MSHENSTAGVLLVELDASCRSNLEFELLSLPAFGAGRRNQVDDHRVQTTKGMGQQGAEGATSRPSEFIDSDILMNRKHPRWPRWLMMKPREVSQVPSGDFDLRSG